MKRFCVCVATSEKTWPRNELIIHDGFSLEPLPGGFEYLLLHGSNALCEHSRESFDHLPEEIRAYLPKLHRKLHGAEWSP